MGNKQIYEEIQTAVVNGDFDSVRKYFHDDFALYEPEVLPYGGVFVGPDGFLELTRKIRTSYEVGVVKAELTEAGDDLLVCEYLFAFTSLRTGQQLETGCIDLFRFKDAKLLRADIYYTDPGKLAALA